MLTHYGNIDGRDVEHEVFAVRARNEKSDFQAVIERALIIACDYLVPRGLDNSWRDLSLAERYYLRALDIESRGERRKGMYEELARGFGVTDIRPLLKSDKANGARLFTPSGLEASLLAPIGGSENNATALPSRRGRAGAAGPHPFAASPLRHLMFAVRETTAADNSRSLAVNICATRLGKAIGRNASGLSVCWSGWRNWAIRRVWKNGATIPKPRVFSPGACAMTMRRVARFSLARSRPWLYVDKSPTAHALPA